MLYEKIWYQSMFSVPYLTLYDFPEIFSISTEKENQTHFGLSFWKIPV